MLTRALRELRRAFIAGLAAEFGKETFRCLHSRFLAFAHADRESREPEATNEGEEEPMEERNTQV